MVVIFNFLCYLLKIKYMILVIVDVVLIFSVLLDIPIPCESDIKAYRTKDETSIKYVIDILVIKFSFIHILTANQSVFFRMVSRILFSE